MNEKKVSAPALQEEAGKEIRVTLQEMASKLSLDRVWELQTGSTLTVYQMDSSDFMSAVEEGEPAERLKFLVELMKRFSLDIAFEGSIALGPFNLADHSWSFTPGNSGSLRIMAKPTTMRKSLSEIVSFLTKLPVGQALVLKPCQELFIEELSADAMLNYYEHCQEHQDTASREKGQDAMFLQSCPLLEEKGLLLKVYGLNAMQIDRNIDASAGGILFRPVGNAELKDPRVVVGLIAKP
jgi:hypothetical protein